jgi:hypothetical protein
MNSINVDTGNSDDIVNEMNVISQLYMYIYHLKINPSIQNQPLMVHDMKKY